MNKIMEVLKNKMSASLAFLMAFAFSMNASAVDWSAVTGAIDFSGETAAIMAIVGLIAVVLVAIFGGKTLLGLLRK